MNAATRQRIPKRCAYCGDKCQGRTCRACSDLPRLDPGYRPVWDKDSELAAELGDTLADARRRGANGSYVKGTGRKRREGAKA